MRKREKERAEREIAENCADVFVIERYVSNGFVTKVYWRPNFCILVVTHSLSVGVCCIEMHPISKYADYQIDILSRWWFWKQVPHTMVCHSKSCCEITCEIEFFSKHNDRDCFVRRYSMNCNIYLRIVYWWIFLLFYLLSEHRVVRIPIGTFKICFFSDERTREWGRVQFWILEFTESTEF